MPDHAHSSAVREARQRLAASSFVVRAILELNPVVPSNILDIPCGFGRHTRWLAEQGHFVTAADIDAERVAHVQSTLAVSGLPDVTLVADACKPLLFEEAAFDGAVIADFVEPFLLAEMARLVRPGGFLVYETFSGRGGNWRGLLAPGETDEILRPNFETVYQVTKEVGPADTRRETVKLVALRRLPSGPGGRVSE